MPYNLDQFIADCRTNLTRDPGPDGREQVRTDLEKLLQNPQFIAEYCGDDQPRGLKVLYEDPKLGFQVLAHINDKARVSPPHDHGASWAIYGQATKYTEMTEWEREDDGGDPKHAKLKPVAKYKLTPGKAGIYQDGDNSLDRLSGLRALHSRHRHQLGQDQPHPHRSEIGRGAPDDAATSDVKSLSPTAVKAAIDDAAELALIDVREELIYSQNHLLWARSAPLSRIELRFARLVPRKDTRIVLIDDNDGIAQRAADILTRGGYSDISYLEGGLAAWEKAGLILFSGMHVPSKAFGEFVEHDTARQASPPTNSTP